MTSISCRRHVYLLGSTAKVSRSGQLILLHGAPSARPPQHDHPTQGHQRPGPRMAHATSVVTTQMVHVPFAPRVRQNLRTSLLRTALVARDGMVSAARKFCLLQCKGTSYGKTVCNTPCLCAAVLAVVVHMNIIKIYCSSAWCRNDSGICGVRLVCTVVGHRESTAYGNQVYR